MTDNSSFSQPISEQIWDGKYKLTTPNPEIANDTTVEDTWKRIAAACAYANKTIYGNPPKSSSVQGVKCKHKLESKFYDALEDFKFLPAGRITAGAGSGRQVTLFNCYVMGTIPDDLAGIFDMLKEAALTMQQGGGIGYDFSPLRPQGAPVKGVDADASGPLTFMDVWDTMCKTIMSAGSRRGAMMATMDCTHPDVMKFVEVKKDPLRLRMFNVSVLASDDFMRAVENDEEWVLKHKIKPTKRVTYKGHNQINGEYVYEVIRARELWETIMHSTYNQAEPGIIFIDTINKQNNLWYMEDIRSTNPCGEQPLPPYGACLLGSINLPKFVQNAFQSNVLINDEELIRTVKAAVQMLDGVIDISIFPLPQQEAEAKEKRRMGIGVTGLADMLFMMGFKYGSNDAIRETERVMEMITIAAYEESINLAKRFGPCPATSTITKRTKFIHSGFMKKMPDYIKRDIYDNGIRNALLTSIAPTGTISLYAGNVSSGGEPIFAPEYTRKVLNGDGTKREEKVMDYAIQKYHEFRDTQGQDKDPNLTGEGAECLVTAQTLSPHDHLVMQAALQKWVDSSISKTINCPEDISFDEFQDVYMAAWKMGCKGCTTYRPNDITGSVLSIEDKVEDTPFPNFIGAPEPVDVDNNVMARPDTLSGSSYKIRWEGQATYVTINDTVDSNSKTIPFEIFINAKNMEHFQWTVALTRMISAVFRRGGNINFVVEELKSVMDPNGGQFVAGKGYIPSFIALLGDVVETHLKNIGYIKLDQSLKVEETQTFEELIEDQKSQPTPKQCPNCNGFNIVNDSGCPTCKDCGHSKCG